MKPFSGKNCHLLSMAFVLLLACPLLLLAQKNNAEHPLAQKVKAYRQAIADHEINDFYRLTERGPTPVNLTYYFDPDEKITGILVFSAGKTADRFEEFKKWAEKNRPADLKYLMPEGEIIPTLDRAQKWRVLLNEWRKSIGLPAIE